MRGFMMLVFLSILPGLAAAQGAPAAGKTGDVLVVVKGIRSATGKIHAGLFRKDDGFPRMEKAFRKESMNAELGAVIIEVVAVPTGTWAVVVYQDLDGDGALKTDMFGVPEEPYGYSRNQELGFGGVVFSGSDFEVKAERAVRVNIDLNGVE